MFLRDYPNSVIIEKSLVTFLLLIEWMGKYVLVCYFSSNLGVLFRYFHILPLTRKSVAMTLLCPRTIFGIFLFRAHQASCQNLTVNLALQTLNCLFKNGFTWQKTFRHDLAGLHSLLQTRMMPYIQKWFAICITKKSKLLCRSMFQNLISRCFLPLFLS